jgi:signal transduction histidine kinase
MIEQLEHQVSRLPWQLILLVCIVGASALLVMSEISHRQVASDYEASFDSLRTHARVGRVARRLSEAEAGQRGYLLTHDPQYLEYYSNALPYFKPLFEQLALHYAQVGTDDQKNATIDPRLNQFIGLTGKRLGELELTINLAKAGNWNEANNILKSGAGKRDMDSIRALVEELQKEEDATSALAIKKLQRGIEVSRWTINIFAALNILLLVLVMLWLRAESRHARTREAALEDMVQERTEQLAVLATHLQQMSETEKTRLGRELHDELGAILTASKMDLAWVKTQLAAQQPALIEKLNRAMKNLDQGIQIKRRIIEGLRPTTLASFGLMTAVRELIEAAAEQCNWTLEQDLPETDPDLSEEAEITMFRILQESVNNIAKYAKASRVRISLHCMHGEHCKLEIEDNGVGFRQADVRPKAAGLIGMRERLRAQGGNLDIESGPGKGTLIRALLPLDKQEANAGGGGRR